MIAFSKKSMVNHDQSPRSTEQGNTIDGTSQRYLSSCWAGPRAQAHVRQDAEPALKAPVRRSLPKTRTHSNARLAFNWAGPSRSMPVRHAD